MYEIKNHEVPEQFARNAIINKELYEKMYKHSLSNPDQFWAGEAQKFVTWYKPWDKVSDCNFMSGQIQWFEGAKLNVSYNCIDRHLEKRGMQIALIWEGDDPDTHSKVTYNQLYKEVVKFSNTLKKLGVKKGDRVCIYMPMILETVYAMLACTRIGAVHSVVFGGFSSESLKDRILDSNCTVVITADEGIRGKKIIPLKNNVDKALEKCPNVRYNLVVKRTGGQISWHDRDVWYHEANADVSDTCEPEIMDAEDPMFILYTSGSTGKPKGVLHTTGGYLLYAAMTHKYVFDYHDNEVYWCTADVGWITGHSYIVYGPLCNGATSLIFEGIPNYPDSSRFWQVCDKHSVNIFYTAPTAIRALMRDGEEPVRKTSRKTLRILGTVGEPINPEVWEWYYHVVGDSRCPVVDTWWQTETGGHIITPLPGATMLKPGSATIPFFGIEPAILNDKGEELLGECEGTLVIKRSWPGQMRTVYGDHKRFFDTYFKAFQGYFFTGDGARRDKDGYFWITGRVDDVLKVSGHRIGTAEVESAIVLHESVAEAAVVGYPHAIKGEGIYAYVTLVKGIEPDAKLKEELVQIVRREIGPVAHLDVIQWAPALPKTRSGKIMRRILRKIACNDLGNLGDISTLADPGVVEDLKVNRILPP
ncbi:MAG: acetate--CoA ligase [Spirochaetia bacterium]|nr:acetate--CoA ligase [Spirochaetia bacterium]